MMCDPWPIVWPCNGRPAGSDEQLDAAMSAAQSLLWARTGRRLGVCTAIERYSARSGTDCGMPYMTDDRVWHNAGASNCSILLVQQPVVEVVNVWVDGVLQDAGGWRLEAGGFLIRGGITCWPVSITGAPRVQVEYRWGVPLTAPDAEATPAVAGSPLWGLAAAAMGEVATEFLNAICGRECRLPSRITSVTRQGITRQFVDPTALNEAGLLGLEVADALIQTVNPNRGRQRSRIYSPDVAERA